MPKTNTIKDFWKKVDVKGPNDCWEWQAALNVDGYGMFSYIGRTYKAHRWIYQYMNNKTLSKSICVCHSCDNPPCCNPSHLWEGTTQENTKDRDLKGRFRKTWKLKSRNYKSLKKAPHC
jgi:hypothetical protein